ncbi:MAG: hypothetical protein ABEJ40_08085 [Haloarculaceae archaeon]
MSACTCAHAEEPADPPRGKATLFCPECGHESPHGGDWRRRERDGRIVSECPVCGTEIASRGRP